MPLNSESLTYWYFRLNGFFTIPNFIVHPDRGNLQHTDVDVLGIRLKDRQELVVDPMTDDALFTNVGKAFIAIAEVKRDRIAFNRTWTEPDLQNVHRFLRACGAFPSGDINTVAEAIYQHGLYTGDAAFHVSLIGIGRHVNATICQDRPGIPQITWDHIAGFIFSRFRRYRRQKSHHDQWSEDGQELWNLWERHAEDKQAFRVALDDAL
ncbi:MAG: hypothetical protein WDO24_28990 [Pseudomonadota bacterium]